MNHRRGGTVTDALRSFHLDDRPRSAEPAGLASYLRWWSTPGVSIAIIDDGSPATTWCAGVRDSNTEQPVDPSTLFQAGSISKSVAAACALRLVAESVIGLDDDIHDRLRSWRLPHNDGWLPHITLRQLLSHTAGLTVHGFPGYPAGQRVPTLPEVLDGVGNTPPVFVTTMPGLQFSYSGGGYCVMQQLLVDMTEMPFAELAYELVLDPAGMTDSTYEQPLPRDRDDAAASGHRFGGRPVSGRWHTYPEQAAAGLWTTPSDLATFFVAIRHSRAGRPDALLPQELAEQMATPYASNVPYGLGLQLGPDDKPPSIGHSGSDEGFRADAVLHDTGQGAVIMTNSDVGGELITEVIRPALVDHLGWPTPATDASRSSTAGSHVLAGRYRAEQGTIELSACGDDLELRALGQPPVRLVRDGDRRWRCVTLRLDATFPDLRTVVLHQHAQYVDDVTATRVD
ncbi:MAG TPA: serine hydrolase domain-containing protein [Nocardioidaceae bacterium]|nr:serine hydrolase domain-containing protein [Nocardioidaceae bacterium]